MWLIGEFCCVYGCGQIMSGPWCENPCASTWRSSSVELLYSNEASWLTSLRNRYSLTPTAFSNGINSRSTQVEPKVSKSEVPTGYMKALFFGLAAIGTTRIYSPIPGISFSTFRDTAAKTIQSARIG